MGLDYTSGQINCEICGSSQSTVIRENISLGKGLIGKLPVVACNSCGFLYQNPRFEKRFYDDYYSFHYRNVIFGNADPSPEFVEDQISRGRILFDSLKDRLPSNGAVLDVGCSVGGMLIPFLENNWEAFGTDPDTGFVRYGKEKLGLPVEAIGAEMMELEDSKYDLIIIMGSLEHVYDPNKTLEICRKAAKPNSLLLLEGRGHPQSPSSIYFNQNHHRYFTLTSIQLMMMKFGWEPIYATDEPLCGPTRPGGIYCLGRLAGPSDEKKLQEIIKHGRRETVNEILDRFNLLDLRFGEN